MSGNWAEHKYLLGICYDSTMAPMIMMMKAVVKMILAV